MQVICISGKAQSGKDSMANALADELIKRGKRVIIYHHADYLKYLCKQYFGWNGIKDEDGRTILQNIGTDIVRNKNPNFWVDTAITFFDMFGEQYDYALIADCRFPNEIDSYKKRYPTTSLRVHRVDFDNGLTHEQKTHASETSLDNYPFDVTVNCESGLDNVLAHAKFLLEEEIIT